MSKPAEGKPNPVDEELPPGPPVLKRQKGEYYKHVRFQPALPAVIEGDSPPPAKPEPPSLQPVLRAG